MKIKNGIFNFVILFIVIAMSFSLTACGGKKPEGGDPQSPVVPPQVSEYIYTYNYNEATGNDLVKSIEFNKEDDLAQTTLIIPTRDGYEFDGWYSDWYFRTQVSDEQGKILIGEDIYNLKSKDFFAKWRNDNAPIYPILMVFVTEVDAVLKTIDGVEIEVKYSMKADERKACEIIVNPSGKFTIWGSYGDSGCVGRKIVVDTYGGIGRVGGGCFSSKNATKVDRSGAYYARYVAKNIVAKGFATKCEIQISYAIGLAGPLSVYIDTFETNLKSMEEIENYVKDNFDFRPANIIKELDLLKPIYKATACFGHFGCEEFTWEKIKE